MRHKTNAALVVATKNSIATTTSLSLLVDRLQKGRFQKLGSYAQLELVVCNVQNLEIDHAFGNLNFSQFPFFLA